MKILVTGGNGFIGSHLIPRLVELEHDVYSLERYVTGRYVLGGERTVKTVFCDLRDHFAVRSAIRNIEPEAVIHLASISSVSYSYEHPQEVIETNFLGTVNLAEACMREVPSFKHFLFAGTSEEYGNSKVNPKTEDSPMCPNSPYSASKVAADKYLQYMRDAYGFPTTVLRNFNTYGRKDNTNFVVERTIVQMLKGKNVRLGDPLPVRDFLYVDDHVNSFLTCLSNGKALGEVFNFCTGRGTSIKQLVELISELTGFRGQVNWNTIPSRPLDIAELVGDCSKANRLLDWRHKYELKDGLQLTIDFWKTRLG